MLHHDEDPQHEEHHLDDTHSGIEVTGEEEVHIEGDDIMDHHHHEGATEEDEAAHKILGLQTQGEEDVYMTSQHNNGDVDMGSESQDAMSMEASKLDPISRSVYVGNVDYAVTVGELRDHFAACGNIHRVTIMMNKQTGQPMGYGFIEFQKAEGATNALMLDETELKDRIIKVALKRKNVPGMGRCASRGGRGGGAVGGSPGMMNMNDAFQAMMMNPMMMSMMAMMNQGGMMGGRGRGRGRGGRGGSRGGSAPMGSGRGDMKRSMK